MNYRRAENAIEWIRLTTGLIRTGIDRREPGQMAHLRSLAGDLENGLKELEAAMEERPKHWYTWGRG